MRITHSSQGIDISDQRKWAQIALDPCEYIVSMALHTISNNMAVETIVFAVSPAITIGITCTMAREGRLIP